MERFSKMQRRKVTPRRVIRSDTWYFTKLVPKYRDDIDQKILSTIFSVVVGSRKLSLSEASRAAWELWLTNKYLEHKKIQFFSYRDQSEADTDTEIPIKGTSKTLEDILRDSDSDMEYMDEDEPRKPKGKGKKNQAWIQDDPENIVDLADVSAARKITGELILNDKLIVCFYF